MSSNHDAHNSDSAHIIDENSIQDKILSALAVMVLIGLLMLGSYWQSLPLAIMQAEEQSETK